MARLVSFVVLAGIIILFAVIFFQVMAQFLLPMFLAVILVVVFRPVHQWFIVKCGGRVRTAAGLTTMAILVMVLAPLLATLALAIRDATEVVQEANSTVNRDPDVLLSKLNKLRQRFGLDLGLPIEEIKKLPQFEARLDELQNGAVTSRTRKEQWELLQKLAPHGPGVDPATPSLFRDLQDLEKSIKPQRFERDKSQPPDADAVKKAADFRSQVQSMKAKLAELEQMVGPSGGVSSDDEPAAPGFDKGVTQLQEAYSEFKAQSVGGTLMENLRLWANPTREDIAEVRTSVVNWIQTYALATGTAVGGFVVNLIISLAVLVISLYYFLADGPAMISTVMRLLPLDDRYERQLLEEFDRISRAVVLATILSALVQGLLAGIGFYLAGIEAVFLLMVLTMMLALVPFVGAAAVWGTVSVWLLVYKEAFWPALLLAIYGVAVISMADNIIKPIVLHGQSKLHPLLALLSVLGGVRALGPIGIFVGPMAVAFLQALLNILNTELTAMSQQRVPTLHAPE